MLLVYQEILLVAYVTVCERSIPPGMPGAVGPSKIRQVNTKSLKEEGMMKRTIGLCIMMGMLLVCGAAKGDMLLSEDWSSYDFATNDWTVDGDNWEVGRFGEIADFWWEPEVTDYEQSLTSKIMDGSGFDSVLLNYDITLYNWSTATLEQFAVNVYNGFYWEQVALYDNADGTYWSIHESIDISAYASEDLRVQFTAFGINSYNIDGWFIDNIQVVGNSAVVPAPGAAILALLGLLTVQMRRRQ